jgi:hypothetical protein
LRLRGNGNQDRQDQKYDKYGPSHTRNTSNSLHLLNESTCCMVENEAGKPMLYNAL